MDPTKIRRLPALEEYLQLQPVEFASPDPEPARSREPWVWGSAAFALMGLLALPVYGWAVAMIASLAVGVTAAVVKAQAVQRQAMRRAPRFEGVPQIKSKLTAICLRKRVHREMDAGAAIALESCARSYLRIRRLLTSAAWMQTIDENWVRMRSEAMDRADDAMDEAIYLSRSWIGEARQARKTNWKKAFGDLLEGDFDDVIERFAESDDDEDRDFVPYTNVKRSTKFALQPVRDIGLNLKRLAQELEEATTLVGRTTSAPETRAPAQTDLEKTLQNLRELKQAESELNDAVQLRLKG